MPRSATGTWTAEAGFTLLEIMVVLALVGIIASFALLRLPVTGGEARLDQELRRLSHFITLHRDAAILLGEPRGIRFDDTGYIALRSPERGRWQPLAETAADQRLPSGLGLELRLEGRPVSLTGTEGPPHLRFWPTGETSAFRLELHASGGARMSLDGDLLGQLTRTASTP